MTGSRISLTEITEGLSVVVPAYNEVSGIKTVLLDLCQVFSTLEIPWEIIVVDDGSNDLTGELVTAICESETRVQVVRHHRNLGYGAALKTGIRNSKYEWICITDADGTYPAEQIPVLLKAMQEQDCDMVVGARIGKGAAIPMARRPAKWLIARLAELIAGDAIPDLNSGLRIFKRDVVQSFILLLPDGFSFTTTITLGMLVNGYHVVYLPVDYYVRKGRSKIHPIYDTFHFIRLVLQIALYFAPMTIFMPLSLSLFTLGLCWAAFSHFVLGRLADVSSAVIIMTAVQVAVVGLLADLINRRLPGYHKKQ